MLDQARDRARDEFNESNGDTRDRVEGEVMLKLVEEQGGDELFGRLKKLKNEVEDVETALERLGFEYRYSQLTFSSDASKALRQKLKAAKLSAQKETQLSLRKFDLGILGVWAAETADDARKIVEGLL